MNPLAPTRTAPIARLHLLVLLAALLCAGAGHAASSRMALVIGNASYDSMPLQNPGNDARAMAKALKNSGFRVITLLDADLQAMQSGMLDFVSKLNEDSTALVFYAGHGMQANGRNYLLPVDAEIDSERALKFQALDLTDLLEEMEASGARINVVILDACRNNPFERKLRGRGRGLAAVDAASGTLIAYATAPGSTASDGAGSNGLYTSALLNEMTVPGRSIEQVFKRVRIAVNEASGGEQVPWESSSLTGDFSFVSAAGATIAAEPESVLAPKGGGADREAMFWDSISESDDVQMYQAYLDRYPNGTFATIAELKVRSASSAEANQHSTPALKDPPASSSCADLTGDWHNSVLGAAGLCSPKRLSFQPAGKNRYLVEGRACFVKLRGMAELKGSELQLDWKMSTCSGTSVFELDQGCASGSGEQYTKGTLVCKGVKGAATAIQRIGS